MKQISMTGAECAHCGAEQLESARFCSRCGARLSADSVERRPLAVLFCDIVGSTSYLRKLGADDWLTILREFHETTSRVVFDLGGYVAQHLGDGQLVYFGFPEAHDDDARRAVEAGLGIIAMISELNARLLYRGWPELRVRIGIATGRTLMGSIGSRAEPLAHGETPHLAARLQSLAEPNTILIDQGTYRLVEGFFKCQTVDGKTPKDFPTMSLHRVLGRTGARTRFDLSTVAALTPFVGRASELEILGRAWEGARSGKRQIVLVRAEAGMGKTRLVQTFRGQLEGANHVLECRGSPYHQNRALFPIVDMLERSLGMQPDDSAERRMAKLESWLTGSSALGSDARDFFAPLFALKVDSYPTGALRSPQKQRQHLFASLFNWIDFLSRRDAVLLILEDAHWADPSTLEFFDGFAKNAASSRCLMVVTARPEFENRWAGVGVELQVDRLPDDETRQIVTSIVPDVVVPPSLLTFVLAKADGVPLFAEELTKTLAEAGVLQTARDQGLSATEVDIPSQLLGVLMARLDRLGRAKQTAQLAATLGREFRRDILEAVASIAPENLAEDFRVLIDAGLIYPLSGATFTFKHALIRDAAYQLGAIHAQQATHGEIASTLEKRFPDIATTQPDLLAFHHCMADKKGRAVPYAQAAAEQALQRCAYSEANVHASNAISWAESLGTPKRADAELAANGVLSQAVMATRGWADPQVEAIAARSTTLLREVEPFNRHRIPTLWSLFAYHHTASHRPAAEAVAREIFRVAEASGDPGFRAAAATILGIAIHPQGQVADTRQALKLAIELYDPEVHRDQGPKMGLDSLVLAKTLLAQIHWLVGDDSTAFALVSSALDWARDIAHVPSLAIGLLYGCQVHQYAGNRAAAGEMASEILALSQKYGLPAYEGYAAIMEAWVTGNEERADAILNVLTAMGCHLGLTYWSSLVADTLAERGSFAEALGRVDKCLSLCAQHGEYYYEPQLRWRRGVYLLALKSDAEAARACFECSATLARRGGAPRIELLATHDILKHFGEDAGLRARVDTLLASHPELRREGIGGIQ